jgi:predicted acylesterase/phospholipase RssA
MDTASPRRLRADLPFRRVAVVLSGGGALAAYEVGVMRAFERLGLRPAIVAGVSSGAMNAVIWISHGFRTDRLGEAWRALRGSSVGMRWMSLAWQVAGSFLVVFATLQVLLGLAGSTELSIARWTGGRIDPGARETALVLDVLAWVGVGAVGAAMLAGARRAEELLARWRAAGDPEWRRRWLGRLLVLGLLAHVAAWLLDWPYPHRFSLSVLLVAGVIWISELPGKAGNWVRTRALRLLPEGGRLGLWNSDARKRILIRWITEGDPRRLLDPSVHLIMSACDLNTGRMHFFANWAQAGDSGFAEGVARRLGEVEELTNVHEVVDAALASSAVPLLFEPVARGSHRFVDGGVFSNQPLHAVIADGADAVIVVLLSPAEGLSRTTPQHLVSLGFRLLEIANWRDVRAELDGLPPGWTREPGAGPDGVGTPARLCVIEPEGALPGGMYGYSTANAEQLIRRGEGDAWDALERAGWLAGA